MCKADFAWDHFAILKLAVNTLYAGLPRWLSGKESTCNAGNAGSIPGFGRSPGIGNGSLTPVFLPGKSHGQREPADHAMITQLPCTGHMTDRALIT